MKSHVGMASTQPVGGAKKPNVAIVQMLPDARANAKRVFCGKTPLQYAKAAGQSEIVSILKQHHKSRSLISDQLFQ